MTYTQAQSARLGQRVAPETTQVQIFDVDPSTPTADLVEAAWPGMLIFRKDRSILQIFNGDEGAWQDVAGGVAGQLTYVGIDKPWEDGDLAHQGQHIGDIYFDSDDQMKQYVWDGSVWEPVAAEGGIHTYYCDGLVPDPDAPIVLDPTWNPNTEADPPETEADRPPLPPPNIEVPCGWELDMDWVPPVPNPPAGETERVIRPIKPIQAEIDTYVDGDLWIQTDDPDWVRKLWRWNDTLNLWEDATSNASKLAMEVAENRGDIIYQREYGKYLDMLSTSTNNTADTADGRVSTSDYKPGEDDLTYPVKEFIWNPDTLTSTVTTVQKPRENGSIWFVHTRPRTNLCTNPSFETNTTFWSTSQCSIQRVATDNVPAGLWTLEVTASAVVGPHVLSWGQASRESCDSGSYYTASIFAELMSGTGNGVTLEIVWHDISGAELTSDISRSDPYDLVQNAWDPEKAGTISEPRIVVTGLAPPTATSFYVREVSPAGNEGSVWHTGACLVEREPDLGRYFDGDALQLGGSWLGTPHNSASKLVGDKIIEIWELRNSAWYQKFITSEAIQSLDTSKLVGPLNLDLIPPNSIDVKKMNATQVIASEALAKGDIVHIWNDNGNFRARKACAAPGLMYEAHGFVVDPVPIAQLGTVYQLGQNTFQDNLPPGNLWLGLTPGTITDVPPQAIGALVQRVGFAPADGVLDFQPQIPVKLV